MRAKINIVTTTFLEPRSTKKIRTMEQFFLHVIIKISYAFDVIDYEDGPIIDKISYAFDVIVDI